MNPTTDDRQELTAAEQITAGRRDVSGFRLFHLLLHLTCLVLGLLFFALFTSVVFAQEAGDARLTVRVKDIAEIEGVRGNQLIGYGLVIGLNRTGDRVQQNLFARQSLQNLLERMGITVDADSLKPENMATVLITGTLPPFARQGSKIDVTASSVGDARSLQGGTLIMTPLKGVDGQIYAMAQGAVSIGGISAGGAGNSVEINHPTVGRVPNGATVERVVPTDLAAGGRLTLVLRQDDFTTASRLGRTVNEKFGAGTAR
ncbi:MAG: flagellar basal body P-ring protein FlgI, partial [Pyrinomonadaceae bacterium]